MKTLLLMRHAKSSWKHPELTDIDRPLNKRGRNDAPLMGTLLRDKELVPELILASSALRARETAEAVAKAAKFHSEIRYMDSFYLAEPAAYLKALESLPDDLERVMIIGHNPGLEGLLQMLSGRIESLPTGALAYLSMPASSWKELIGNSDGELHELLVPKELREGEVEAEIKKIKGKEKEKEKGKAKKKGKKDKK